MIPDSSIRVPMSKLQELEARLLNVEKEITDIRKSVLDISQWMQRSIGKNYWADKVVSTIINAVLIYIITKGLK